MKASFNTYSYYNNYFSILRKASVNYEFFNPPALFILPIVCMYGESPTIQQLGKNKYIAMAFSNLSEKIRFHLYHYLTIDYVVNEVRNGVRKVSIK